MMCSKGDMRTTTQKESDLLYRAEKAHQRQRLYECKCLLLFDSPISSFAAISSICFVGFRLSGKKRNASDDEIPELDDDELDSIWEEVLMTAAMQLYQELSIIVGQVNTSPVDI